MPIEKSAVTRQTEWFGESQDLCFDSRERFYYNGELSSHLSSDT